MKEKIDIFLVIFFPLFAVFVSFKFDTVFLVSTLLFFALPSIYLSYRTPNGILRSAIFSMLFSIVGTLLFDHLAKVDKAWYTTTIFPIKIFGTVTIEDLIFTFLFVYFVTIFYEHFEDKGKHKILAPRMKYFFVLATTVLSVFLLIYLINPAFNVNFTYIKIGSVLFLFPVVAFLIEFPKYISRFLKVAPYFFFLIFSQEIVAVKLNHWGFPGKNFIGFISIPFFGIVIPYEELFLWISISAISVICYFEYFDDNKLRSELK